MPTDDPLMLPAVPTAAARSPFPFVATLVPLLGGVILWFVIGSPFALLFALLGPLVAIGGLLDQVRGGRRRRRRSEIEYARLLAEVEHVVVARHGREREELVARHPDVAAFVRHAEEIWRGVPAGRRDLVVGRGERASGIRLTGDASRVESARIRRIAATLTDAPITVDWRAGLAVRGEPALARAVLRALVLQLCLGHTPEAVRVVAPEAGDAEWMSRLPHGSPGSRDDTLRLVVREGGAGPAPPGVLLTWGPAESTIDPRCGAVLDVREPSDATIVVGADRTVVSVEAVSDAQARAIAHLLEERGEVLYGRRDAEEPVMFADVRGAPGVGAPGGLAVALGRDGGPGIVVDLVADGPHAVVTGVTGSGKSELLTTWIAALCSAYSTREVAFLLADFKGGMTFDALADLPHVTGVISDLDGGTAERAIASLRAELRRREHELARSGARDIADARIDLPRLVIVVDEFAALVAEHDGLHRIFADVAARGRALGMHLILGSQRVSGAMPDALLANCPLRIALRAADTADSRAVLGDESAARLPGGAEGRGRAYLRRAGDIAPLPVRVALTSTSDLTELGVATQAQTAPRAPWLPALPNHVALADLRGRTENGGGILLALADDPARQRQFPIALAETGGLAVIGRSGSGKSSVIALIAAQLPDAVVISDDLEAAWDALSATDDPGLLLVDDADDLLARFPPDHALAAAERLERIARTGRLVVTVRAPSGRIGRIVDSLPQRAVLALASRADHVAAGGEGIGFRPDLPPGRGRLSGWDVQFARVDARPESRPVAIAAWRPGLLAGVVTRRVDAVAEELRSRGAARVRQLRDVPLGARLGEVVRESESGQILVGDGEDWLARWGLLQEMRSRYALVVDADCAAELRTVAGERALPPYVRPGAGRAWLCAPAAQPTRVELLGMSF